MQTAAPLLSQNGRQGLPKTKVKASIIIVNYNRWGELEACLRSLQNDPHPDYEMIVVDNNSSDGSRQKIAGEFPDVKPIYSEENLGFGGGNNLAAEEARGQYLAFLNPDTVVEPGWLAALIAALDADPGAGLATSKILLLKEPEKINTCGNDIHISGLTLCRGMGRPSDDYNQAETVDAVSGAAFAMRRDLFEALGGFDPLFFLYMEDTDLSLRARLAGYRCLFVPESVVYHDYTLRFGPRKTYYQERNRYLMLLKSLGGRTLLALVPALLLAEVVTWGFVLTRERRNPGNKLRAYAWVIGHWGEVWTARRRTQALRRISDGELLATARHDLGYEQTGPGWAAKAAHLFFDPLFAAFQRIMLAFASPLRGNV